MVTAVSSESAVKTTTTTPQKIRRILLNDGWHNVSNCEFTHFAVSPGMSPPQPNSLYSALSYQESSQSASGQSGSNRQIVTPLSKISAFDIEDAYES